jgi:hypothetical protein
MTDHYGDAIRAGAAALAAPYREAETIRAFTDEYPTLAAARVLDAALPHMRSAIIAEGITPGPCPAVTEFGHQGPYFEGHPDPNTLRTLRALCDLRAGHAGQHEAESEQWGNFRWTDEPARETYGYMCRATRPDTFLVCALKPDHRGYHIDGFKVWDGCGNVIADD